MEKSNSELESESYILPTKRMGFAKRKEAEIIFSTDICLVHRRYKETEMLSLFFGLWYCQRVNSITHISKAFDVLLSLVTETTSNNSFPIKYYIFLCNI